jgi:Icc-related predicted phosphoesterase
MRLSGKSEGFRPGSGLTEPPIAADTRSGMKILCISDTVDPLVDSAGIRERFGAADLVLAAGDLPTEYLSYVVSALDRPLLFVYGNHDEGPLPAAHPEGDADHRNFHYYDRDTGATYVGFRLRREAGLIVMGLGGSIRYNNGRNQYSQAQMWLRVAAMAPVLLVNRLLFGRAVDVVLTHAPPKGIHDGKDACHRGFAAYLWLMRAFRPRYLVHGHVHVYDSRESRVATYRHTEIINAYGHYVVDTGDDRA